MHASMVQNIFQFMDRCDYSIDSDFPCVRDLLHSAVRVNPSRARRVTSFYIQAHTRVTAQPWRRETRDCAIGAKSNVVYTAGWRRTVLSRARWANQVAGIVSYGFLTCFCLVWFRFEECYLNFCAFESNFGMWFFFLRRSIWQLGFFVRHVLWIDFSVR